MKSLEEFRINGKRKDGSEKRQSYCKPCQTEYGREWRHANPASFREYKRKYRETHPEEVREAKRQAYHRNRERARERQRQRRKEQPEAWAEYYRRRREIIPVTVGYAYYKHRLTLERRERILDAQGNVCAVCKVSFEEKRSYVDHDHACCPGSKSCGECIRGLLCPRCNSSLGWYENNRAAIDSYVGQRAVS